MPEAVEKCVESRLADPDFKPKEKGQTKEEAAWALCTWLYNEGLLEEKRTMAWKVGAARNLKIVHSSSWDGQKAENQIFKLAGWPDEPKGSTARKGFLIYNDDDVTLKGNYKLPFCYVRDGELVAVDAGLNAARRRLPRTDAPQEVLDRAQAVLDAYKKRQEKESKSLIQDGSRSFRITLPIMRVDPPEGAKEGLWIRVEASGPERDGHNTRMSEQCLERFVTYAEEGIDGSPLPFLDGHYQDLLAAMLGEIHAPYLTEERHFAFYARLDERNPQAIRLYDDLGQGKRHGASIAGWAHEFENETWTDDDGEEKESIIFHDIELVEVSRTSWPSWQPAFCELVAKKLSTEPLDITISRRARQVRDAVTFCKSDGVCMQLAGEDGKVSIVNLYALSLALTRDFSPELVGAGPERLLEGLLDSGIVDVDEVMDCARSASEFISEMPLADRVKLGIEVMGVFRSHLLREPPLPLLTAYGRASDKLELGDLFTKSVQAREGSTMAGNQKDTVDDPAVEQVAGVEETPENSQKTRNERGMLSDTVDARMLGQRFAEATWAMQDLVFGSLFNKEMPLEDRVNQAEAVIDEFATMGKDLINEMANTGYVPRSVDELRQLSVASVELTEGKLSRTRIELLRQKVTDLFQEGVDLMDLLEKADDELEDLVEPEEPDDDVTPEAEEESAVVAASNRLQKRLDEMDEQRKRDAERVFEILRRSPAQASDPAGNTAADATQTPSPKDQKDAEKKAFLESLEKGRRAPGRKRQ